MANTGCPAKITKDAAGHFLAKAYLSRASEINDSWNSSTKAADLAAIVPLCDAVIANHPLAPNFGDLWRYTAPNGANENLKGSNSICTVYIRLICKRSKYTAFILCFPL